MKNKIQNKSLPCYIINNHSKKEQDLFNAMGSMYAAVTFIGVVNGASVQPIVAIERTVFYRERAAGMYSAMPYALAQVLITPLFIFIVIITTDQDESLSRYCLLIALNKHTQEHSDR
jgi:hypothetical protein